MVSLRALDDFQVFISLSPCRRVAGKKALMIRRRKNGRRGQKDWPGKLLNVKLLLQKAKLPDQGGVDCLIFAVDIYALSVGLDSEIRGRRS